MKRSRKALTTLSQITDGLEAMLQRYEAMWDGAETKFPDKTGGRTERNDEDASLQGHGRISHAASTRRVGSHRGSVGRSGRPHPTAAVTFS